MKRILIVDNHSKHIRELAASIPNHEVAVLEDLGAVDAEQFDGIVLSGGSEYPVVGHDAEFADELALIKSTTKPVLGICQGFELMCHAFGEELVELSERSGGNIEIDIDNTHPLFNDLPDIITVHEAHRWGVQQVHTLVAIGSSARGVEAVAHPKKQLYGVQFHPEALQDNHNKQILHNFIRLIPEKEYHSLNGFVEFLQIFVVLLALLVAELLV